MVKPSDRNGRFAQKPRILLIWNYDRADWIAPFLELREDFEFCFLSKYFDKQDTKKENTQGLQIHYWTEFRAPLEVLKRIQPDLVVFMSLNNFPEILLNAAAKRIGITTTIIQHGLYFSQKTYKIRQQLKSTTPSVKATANNSLKLWMARFLFSGLSTVGVSGLIRLVRYLYDKRNTSDIEALERNQFAERMPDRFIVFTEENGRVFVERDGASFSDFDIIGNPSLDKFFERRDPADVKFPLIDYYLLIDTPLYAERSEFKGFSFTRIKAQGIYNSILQYAREREKKLVIKLHPFSFNEDQLLEESDVLYVRDEYEQMDLIMGAHAVISFPSTLMLPAIYLKPTLLLAVSPNNILEEFRIKKLLPVLNISDLGSDERLPDPQWSEEVQIFLLDNYLYAADGKSLDRLKRTLLKLCAA